jgi:hypothetical protein
MIVQVSSMRQGHGPQAIILHIWPVECSMDHHGTSLGNNNTDGAFSYSVLPLGTNTAESNGLDIIYYLLNKTLALESTIICVVGFNRNTMGQGHPLETVLGCDSVSSIQSNLMFEMNDT